MSTVYYFELREKKALTTLQFHLGFHIKPETTIAYKFNPHFVDFLSLA